MSIVKLKHVSFLAALTALLSFCLVDAADASMGTYIIHAIKPDNGLSSTLDSENLESWYQSLLPTSTTNDVESQQQQRLIYTYTHATKGFAAKLTKEEAEAMKAKQGVVSVLPDVYYSLHTTHSPQFLGLNRNLGVWKDSNLGKGVIIGVVDTGIQHDHLSFSDHGMPPPPSKWKGFCEFTGKSTCNNKLIGARNIVNKFSEEKEDPSDLLRHGTHTSGTAAGTFVSGANAFGNAQGTAVGMAPLAHIAMYKVCTMSRGCPSSAILAAFDIAIQDGVDILSLSLGIESVPFFVDVIALGALAATQKGIFISCSAGNSGPEYGTLGNEAPWILTVGASTIDRSIRATVKLGNGAEYEGQSIFQFQQDDFNPILRPLVFPGANSTDSSIAFCAPGSLTNIDVKGKVVLCIIGGFVTVEEKGEVVKNAGGAAMILANEEFAGFSLIDATSVLPSSQVSYDAGLNIRAYINSTSTPTATIIFKGTVIGDSLAPEVIHFSSRGPNQQSPGILKPDIIGPGVNILAAWPVSVDNATDSNAAFNMISGTSMSCPHLSGIAALIRSAHPDWSPAAVKSAIMTTAHLKNLGGERIVDQTHTAADLFATGAGHVNPSKANDPGLVYDIQPDDYIPYLCGLRYTDAQVSVLVQRLVKCSEVKPIQEAQLNYPSFSIFMENETQGYTRTVTNVGPAKSTYKVEINVPVALGMSVNPTTLTFTEVNQKLSYFVEFIPQIKENRGNLTHTQGYIKWVSDNHSVTSPISVTFK